LNLRILGGGTEGTIAAWAFAQRGQRVAVIERKYIGGSWRKIASLPSKNVIHRAKAASYLRRSEEFGIAKEMSGSGSHIQTKEKKHGSTIIRRRSPQTE
jgi:pyruvate/2-oxoglutarate dehydrogenase complex dihydrolipoamide dehydrogenase (E3) component